MKAITPQEKLTSLKNILLSEEREDNQRLRKKLKDLEVIVKEREELSKLVSPIFCRSQL